MNYIWGVRVLDFGGNLIGWLQLNIPFDLRTFAFIEVGDNPFEDYLHLLYIDNFIFCF